MNGISKSTVKTIILVHGGFVDGSGWEDVYKILKKDERLESRIATERIEHRINFNQG
jgi:hypothetical protein